MFLDINYYLLDRLYAIAYIGRTKHI